MKQPRKVALINVADFPRDRYSAYWAIQVDGSDEEGYRWGAQLLAYKPVGWSHQGKVKKERPDIPKPVYPSDSHLARQAEFLRMTPAQRAEEIKRQEAFRAECSRIHEANPRPVYLIEEGIGVADTRDEADTAAQAWVKARIANHRKPGGTSLHAFALVLNPFDLADALRSVWQRVVRPLLAIAYATTVRNNRMNQVRDAIDAGAGAGLMRIYDGTRPATCGVATTLLAELTHSDPCAGAAASGVLTFSAITADASANATGTATWYRDVDSTGTCAVDGAVGTAGSDLNLNSTSISVGQQVSVTSKTYTDGSA